MKFSLQTVLVFSASAVFFSGCGVKGKPQPPLTPLMMSRGEPTFQKTTEKLKINPRNGKKKIDGDFEEADDFSAIPEDKK